MNCILEVSILSEIEKFEKQVAIDQINRFLDRYRELNAKVLDVEYYLSLSEKDRDDLEFAYHTAGCNVAMLVDTFKDLLLTIDDDSAEA